MALLLTLQAKGDYALGEDAKAIEAKLDAAPFAVTLRIVATADGADADARLDAALNQVAEVLGQYHQRTSHHLQTLTQIGAGSTVIDADSRSLPLAARAPRPVPLPELLLPIRPWRGPEMLTSVELAGLWQGPVGSASRAIGAEHRIAERCSAASRTPRGARQGLERRRSGAAKAASRVGAGCGASGMPGTGDEGACQVSREALSDRRPGSGAQPLPAPGGPARADLRNPDES